MKKQLQLFLSREDESGLSTLLKAELADLWFLNDNVWPDNPDCRDGIEDCNSGLVYLYQGSLDLLPTGRRKTGDVEGPTAGCVIQIIRCRFEDGTLLSGSVAAGIADDDERMRNFVSKVWKCVRKTGTVGVKRPDGRIDRHYLVGHRARKLVEEGYIVIADRAVRIVYELCP